MTESHLESHLEKEKQAILARALANAAFDGWNDRALYRAAGEAGYERSMVLRAFPGGARDLLDFYLLEADKDLIRACRDLDLPSLKIRQRIAAIVRCRLELSLDDREAVRRAFALLLLPGYLPLGIGHLARTMDVMWRLAGDNATDFNWYTKRALLSGVYLSTLLYWLNDESEEFAETWEFLERRIADVMKIQKGRGRFDKIAAKWPSPWPLLGRLRHRPGGASTTAQSST